MKIETAHLSVAIENFCFSEIVPARLTKTISLTNVQHFGHFSVHLHQLDTKSAQLTLLHSLEAIYGHYFSLETFL